MSSQQGKLYVAGLPETVDDATLLRSLQKFGKLREARVVLSRETGLSRGFGFVTFDEPKDADDVVANGNIQVEGAPVSVAYARDKPDRSEGRPPGAPPGRSNVCFDWEKNTCTRSNCRFEHPPAASSGYDRRDRGDRDSRDYDRAPIADRGYDRGYGDRGYGDRSIDRGYPDRPRSYVDERAAPTPYRGGYGDRDRGGYSDRAPEPLPPPRSDRGGYSSERGPYVAERAAAPPPSYDRGYADPHRTTYPVERPTSSYGGGDRLAAPAYPRDDRGAYGGGGGGGGLERAVYSTGDRTTYAPAAERGYGEAPVSSYDRYGSAAAPVSDRGAPYSSSAPSGGYPGGGGGSYRPSGPPSSAAPYDARAPAAAAPYGAPSGSYNSSSRY